VRASPASVPLSNNVNNPSGFVRDSVGGGIVFPPTPPPEDGDKYISSSPPIVYPVTSLPQPIPIKSVPTHPLGQAYATPPLTPDDSTEPASHAHALSQEEDDALAFLSTLFPADAAQALPHAQKVSISAAEMGASFEGVVLDLPGDEGRTFYVDGSSAATVNLRESIVALLDLADEQLDCGALIIALDRSSPALSELLHALMYVGGSVVTKPIFPVNPAFVLVGLEI
jgi:hypothetical protein